MNFIMSLANNVGIISNCLRMADVTRTTQSVKSAPPCHTVPQFANHIATSLKRQRGVGIGGPLPSVTDPTVADPITEDPTGKFKS